MTLPSSSMGQLSFPQMYERWLVRPLFRPWAEMTLDEVELSPGHHLLDIACGTGIVARTAKERLGDAVHAVGVDIGPDMLAVARSMAPNIDWREGNASALPLRKGEQFEIVICQQGLQFFPDKRTTLEQMRLALVEGGRLALTTWRSDNEIPLFRDLRTAAEHHLGPIVDQRYGFGDSARLRDLIEDGGFHDIQVRTVTRMIRFDEGAPFLRLNAMAYIGMSAVGKEMSEHERETMVQKIVRDSAPAAGHYMKGSVLAFELSTNLATAKSG